MVRKVLYPAVLVLVLFMASQAYAVSEGGWSFNGLQTVDYSGYGMGEPWDSCDGKIYDHDGTLVQDGSLVQIIVGRDGAEIVDPLDYFDADDSGDIDAVEQAALGTWIRAGADPATISGGVNQLTSNVAGTFTGEFATTGGTVLYAPAGGSEPTIQYGYCQDKLAWRAWNLTKEQLEKWCDPVTYPEMLGVELWYTDGREYFTHDNVGGGPDTGWWVGMASLQPEDDPGSWVGFLGGIGQEVYAHYAESQTTARSENKLDVYLGTCGGEPVIPEPSTMLLIGSAIGLLLIRRKK